MTSSFNTVAMGYSRRIVLIEPLAYGSWPYGLWLPFMTRLLLVPLRPHRLARAAAHRRRHRSTAERRRPSSGGCAWPLLAPFSPTAVYSGPGESAKQAAHVIAKDLGLRTRAIAGLKGSRPGPLAGIEPGGVRGAVEKIARAWQNDPLAVSPPEGESLSDAETRLCDALQKLVKRKPNETLVVVLGPLACAVVRCRFAPDGYERFWGFAEEPATHHELDVKPEDFRRKSTGTNNSEIPPEMN